MIELKSIEQMRQIHSKQKQYGLHKIKKRQIYEFVREVQFVI